MRNEPSLTIIGPPESPWQVSVCPSPAHTASVGLKSDWYAFAQSVSERMGVVVSSSTCDSELSPVSPQPISVACLPADHRTFSPVVTRRIGSSAAGAGVESVKSAESLWGTRFVGGPVSKYAALRSRWENVNSCPASRRTSPSRTL
jgi:hypothetical protein